MRTHILPWVQERGWGTEQWIVRWNFKFKINAFAPSAWVIGEIDSTQPIINPFPGGSVYGCVCVCVYICVWSRSNLYLLVAA